MFEDIFSGWKSGKLTPAQSIKSNKLGFLYRNNDNIYNKAVFFYTRNKRDLIKLLQSIVYAATNNKIEIGEDTSYILLGTINKKKSETRIYINIDDIYRLNEQGEKTFINKIDEVLLMYPQESVFIYRVHAKFYTIDFDSYTLKS